jgi:5'-3' exonuclease
MLDTRITQICVDVDATMPPILFLTGKENFRNDIAVTQVYKDRDETKKPWHYKNIKAYLNGMYDTVLIEGLEADDVMCIEQTLAIKAGTHDTIICSRDKDLRQCPGWHFGWELGRQPAFGPEKVDEWGYIALNDKRKVKGVGLKFFYAQCIMGDRTDSIPGLPKKGDVAAFDIISGANTPEEGLAALCEAYKETMGTSWREYLTEQGQLLYMVRELVDDKPVMWEI